MFSVTYCAQDDWRRLEEPRTAWLLSAAISLLTVSLVVGLGAELGPTLWGPFLGFAVLCQLASMVLNFFAVKRKSRPALVGAKVLFGGVCFGVAGFCMAEFYGFLSFLPPWAVIAIGIPNGAMLACIGFRWYTARRY